MMETFALVAALPISIVLGLLLAGHVKLLWSNKTTIEYQEGVTARRLAGGAAGGGLGGPGSGPGAAGPHPYDLGAYHNLHELLGDNPLTWLLPPWRPAPGGGLSFRTVWDLKGDDTVKGMFG
jgi:hypothetical protein